MLVELLLWSVLCSPTLATDLYVSPSGSDSNDGSSNNPFKSLDTAQEAVRQFVSSGDLESDLIVHLAPGHYSLSAPLNLTSEDSGNNGHAVHWQGDPTGVTISGGLKVTGWEAGDNGIYWADVPPGTQSRNLFVAGKAANYARKMLVREDFTFDNTSMTWNNSDYDYLMQDADIANAEIRFVNSFTDRYAPIQSVNTRELVMKQECWRNQIIGYDTVNAPFADYGVWVQNALSLLSEGGQFFLNSTAGKIYYKPLTGEDMATIDAYLGLRETLLIIGGTYDDPAHDIIFSDINFAHTTWLKPGQGFGYVDQQTGGHIGRNVTYPTFEASRPDWSQMLSAIQVSAAYNITFDGGSYTQIGSGAFGIGNDDNAHTTGVGLGASHVSITGAYFTQVMGNSITAGGIQANAHHPSDERMINSHITISNNIFYNTSSLFTSTVPIFLSYVQYSNIINNDLYHLPYSGICIGYGWGSNDAGGSQTYIDRGLYNYQPLYTTPTVAQNNVIDGNLIHSFGLSHNDLGGVYSLSKSPSSYITNNYAYDSSSSGMYTDEGSNSFIITNNDFTTDGRWYYANQGCETCGLHTANNSLIDNFGISGTDYVGQPHGTGVFGNTFVRNFVVQDLNHASVAAQRTAYRAGILPADRLNRPVSNPALHDATLVLTFPASVGGLVVLNITNFDDVALTDVDIAMSLGTDGYTLSPVSVPTVVSADGFAIATYNLTGSAQLPPEISVSVDYTNPRLGKTSNLKVSGTMPGMHALTEPKYVTSATWSPATFGQTGEVWGIRTSGRDISNKTDDWAAIYDPSAAITSNGSIAVKVLSLNAPDPEAVAGVVVRNSLSVNESGVSDQAGYAAVFVLGGGGVVFRWDSDGNGRLDSQTMVANVTAPVCLQLAVRDKEYTAMYAQDCSDWKQIGASITLDSRADKSDVGLLVNSHAGFVDTTGLFVFSF